MSAALPALIDTHCHLNYDYSPRTLDDLLASCQSEGISHMVTIGTDVGTIGDIQKISDAHAHVYHTVGVHPHDANGVSESDVAKIAQASRHPKCRAIGEIGLDYYYQNSPREAQQQALRWQLDAALREKQPIVIHSRDGEMDLLPELKSYAAKCSGELIPGIIHCFTGTLDFGKACIDLGFFISFSGILTFKNAEDLRVAARAYPLDRLLVETDSPFLAPIPFRGKKCEPAMVKHTALKLAEIKGISFDEVAATTTKNAKRFFRITD